MHCFISRYIMRGDVKNWNTSENVHDDNKTLSFFLLLLHVFQQQSCLNEERKRQHERLQLFPFFMVCFYDKAVNVQNVKDNVNDNSCTFFSVPITVYVFLSDGLIETKIRDCFVFSGTRCSSRSYSCLSVILQTIISLYHAKPDYIVFPYVS